MNYKLFSFDKIPSTQTCALDLVARGRAADRTIILAQAQSAGRARYRRKWVSHHGNLYASFIYDSDERQPTLSYAVAVAVAEALISFGIKPAIKWPNDILIDGKKVSGILIEYAKNFVIIGIGINIKSNPTVTGVSYKTTKLDNYKKNISREDLLGVIKMQMEKWIKKNFSVVRKRWLELATGIGEEIMYKGKPAVFCGINDDGAMILRRDTEYIMAFDDEISL